MGIEQCKVHIITISLSGATKKNDNRCHVEAKNMNFNGNLNFDTIESRKLKFKFLPSIYSNLGELKFNYSYVRRNDS